MINKIKLINSTNSKSSRKLPFRNENPKRISATKVEAMPINETIYMRLKFPVDHFKIIKNEKINFDMFIINNSFCSDNVN